MFQKCAFHYHENAHNATHENYRIGQLLQMLKMEILRRRRMTAGVYETDL